MLDLLSGDCYKSYRNNTKFLKYQHAFSSQDHAIFYT